VRKITPIAYGDLVVSDEGVERIALVSCEMARNLEKPSKIDTLALGES
jgi:hypothetical protein